MPNFFELFSIAYFLFLVSTFEPLGQLQSFFNKFEPNIFTKTIYFTHLLTSCPICLTFWGSFTYFCFISTLEQSFLNATICSFISLVVNKIYNI
jgi:hypothetical protein